MDTLFDNRLFSPERLRPESESYGHTFQRVRQEMVFQRHRVAQGVTGIGVRWQSRVSDLYSKTADPIRKW